MSQTPDTSAEQFGSEIMLHLDTLYRTALHLTRSEADAEDLAQDAVVRALERRSLFQQGTNLRAWLLTIMTRLYINQYHQKQRRPELSTDDVEEFDLYSQVLRQSGRIRLDDPAALVELRLEADDIRSAIGELPDEFRSVVVLSVVNEMSYQDIAEALKIPVGTVRSRLSRGRGLLRRILWRYTEEPVR